uniref:PREDICTED: multidrug resistance protein 3like isoform 2 putative n=1 Tax=Albugo laibachii Nc14 TaxID=890382 RepID=F0WD43_9STRA|nr:PREDICTED: multidrug resistance protein 3like isoform 2 putative [Albugo laibachii Nc14]|eukprot:CCA19115.1 PREDICTED: multidrug resistance protein 3like isoform 2 putative [Albugo laibachii Nc14]
MPPKSLPTPNETLESAFSKTLESRIPPSFAFRDLYRYATIHDQILLLVGILLTCVNGALFPCMALIFGEAISSFQPYRQYKINTNSLLFFGVAILLFLTDYASYLAFQTTSKRQIKRLRQHVLDHLLHLEIQWYDEHDALQLSSRLVGDTVKIQDGMGQKLGDSIRFTAQFIAGYTIGFIKGWDISLVMACVLPCIGLSLGSLIKLLRARSERCQKVYAEAGAIAEETLSSMRTVVSNNGHTRAMSNFYDKIRIAERDNIQVGRFSSFVFGVFYCSMWLMYAAGLWYGGWKVSNAKSSPGSVFQAFYGILIGSLSMAQISPNISAVTQAKGAAIAIYEILATSSSIDASKAHGLVPSRCDGEIRVQEVDFSYPSRPQVNIMKQYSVDIESGQTVAFVGASGGGKSTLVSLLERFYRPNSGVISLDENDIQTLNVKWLRSQIGLVSQEPVLFATTIFENIALGSKASSQYCTQEQVEIAAKLASAHEFIMSLPQQYETLVGEKGISLSGGQKQRIAIARALVREPKILILDEATSALDNESERSVQAALVKLVQQITMTTIVIAHRLTTVRHADKIVVLAGGSVVEEGPHNVLMSNPQGVYRRLYMTQEDSSSESSKSEQIQPASPLPSTQTDAETSSSEYEKSDSVGQQFDTARFEWMKLTRLCRPESRYFIVGIVSSAICGFSFPGSSLLLSGVITTMTEKYAAYVVSMDVDTLSQLYRDVRMYAAIYIGGSVVLMIATAIQQFCFKFMAEKLTTRLRDMHFRALCRQNIAFFDQTEHAAGALSTQLASHATKVALLFGDSQGRLVQAAFTCVLALIISFVLGSWMLSFVMLAIFPLLILGQYCRTQHISSGVQGDDMAESGAYAAQALSNIRTVVSLGLEHTICKEYRRLLGLTEPTASRQAHVNGLALGFSSFITFAAYSLVFWTGGQLIKHGHINFEELMRTLMCIMMSAQSIGPAMSYFADTDSEKAAAASIFQLVEREVPIDSFSSKGLQLEQVQGRLDFKRVYFSYPTRPDRMILSKYSLSIPAGQTVAFCGPSGGGKSTIIALLERFYDPLSGTISLDGVDIKQLQLHWLRSQFGLVGQEPTLFVGSITENLLYGLPMDQKVDQTQVIEAARMANAHDFIMNFPDGYHTQVGMKGEQLSGGQKQRIAIARAILKGPKILLLDEATSALDYQSEKVVQEALDTIVTMRKRTTLIIAHRLSTIRKADKICVVSGGRIAEEGTHEELIYRNGIYKRLISSGQKEE